MIKLTCSLCQSSAEFNLCAADAELRSAATWNELHVQCREIIRSKSVAPRQQIAPERTPDEIRTESRAELFDQIDGMLASLADEIDKPGMPWRNGWNGARLAIRVLRKKEELRDV